ncbi:unnamed protein product [Tenebrio molitor]|nr:unnamed protein product [Tenebrio molitor]
MTMSRQVQASYGSRGRKYRLEVEGQKVVGTKSHFAI